MVRWTTQGRIGYGIKFKICGTILLYSKDRQISAISTRLQEIELAHSKRQDTITTNWRSN